MKWTLEEAKHKLFGAEPELTDLGIARRQLTLDISIAEGESGLSVLLTPSDQECPDGGCWHFSFLVPYEDGVSGPELVEIIARTLGIKPEERIWEDGEELP